MVRPTISRKIPDTSVPSTGWPAVVLKAVGIPRHELGVLDCNLPLLDAYPLQPSCPLPPSQLPAYRYSIVTLDEINAADLFWIKFNFRGLLGLLSFH